MAAVNGLVFCFKLTKIVLQDASIEFGRTAHGWGNIESFRLIPLRASNSPDFFEPWWPQNPQVHFESKVPVKVQFDTFTSTYWQFDSINSILHGVCMTYWECESILLPRAGVTMLQQFLQACFFILQHTKYRIPFKTKNTKKTKFQKDAKNAEHVRFLRNFGLEIIGFAASGSLRRPQSWHHALRTHESEPLHSKKMHLMQLLLYLTSLV